MSKRKDKELILMVGLPRSGKSTFANILRDEKGYPIVNPDSIRLSLHGETFLPSMEPYVWAIARTMVESLFLAGHDTVILDSTAITYRRRAEWLSKKWDTSYVYRDTNKEECIKRAIESGREDLIPIINRMSKVQEGLTAEEKGREIWTYD
jgi:predicted kinase